MDVVSNILNCPLYILEDENNPESSKSKVLRPVTTIDQVLNSNGSNKTLRDVLDELHQEIIRGGKETLVFPVTSVNDQTGDVKITPFSIGLGNVNNTSDDMKPLSALQRQSIDAMLESFSPEVDWSRLNDHLADHNNPHNVTIEMLNSGNYIEGVVNNEIRSHNTSSIAHTDIRADIRRINNMYQSMIDTMSSEINGIKTGFRDHRKSELSHIELFDKKENISNKSISMTSPDDITYPTTKAVSDYIFNELHDMKNSLNLPRDWIEEIRVVNTESSLPPASEDLQHIAYIVLTSMRGKSELFR